jgi:peroxiredoxin Q/BCP
VDKTRITLLIDPPKATKGRRMSKKTRKKTPKNTLQKSPKSSHGKTTRAQSAKPAKTATAKEPGKKTKKQPGNATPAASHKAPSKRLKLVPKKSAVRPAAGAKPIVAKPAAAKPTVRKPPETKAAASAVGKSTLGKSIQDKPALAEGARAPAFRLPRDGGDTVSLADYAGRKLVLFFYPRADTPGCTKEAIDFTRLASAFAESQTAVLGVSADPLKAQESFRDKHQLSIPLASDEKHEMLDAYGVWGEKSMYGKVFQGILRTTVLIGADGRILRIWRHVKVDGHADEVLAAARSR